MKPTSVLIDSHVLVWLLYESKRVGSAAHELLKTCETVLVSDATLMELTFKHGSGKFPYSPDMLFRGIAKMQFDILPMKGRHLKMYADIKLPHKDPFDTLLIAQATAENMPLVTADNALICSDYEIIDARV